MLSHIDITIVALLIQFLISVAFNLMRSFFPLFISADLKYTLIEATYWTGIAQLVVSSLLAATAPFWGFMCDRVGTKRILTVALTGNIIAYVGMGFSTSIGQFLVFRGVQGVFGGLSTVMFTLVVSISSSKKLRKALSYQIAAMTSGSLIGPGMGGALASVMGYRGTFMVSSMLFMTIVPIVYLMQMPPPAAREDSSSKFTLSDLKVILPAALVLVLVYASTTFIAPAIPWFLQLLGVPIEQLLIFTTFTSTLNGFAYLIATPILTSVVTSITMPILSVIAAGAILSTAFVSDPYQFILLRITIGSIQAGITPNLLGRKSERKGTTIGFLNSARFVGMAIGPFIATSILGNGESSNILIMFVTMAGMAFLASFVLYLARARNGGSR